MTRRTFLTRLIQLSGLVIGLANPLLGLAQNIRGDRFRPFISPPSRRRIKTTVFWEDRSGNAHQKVFLFDSVSNPPKP
jgi:hypothetical protein